MLLYIPFLVALGFLITATAFDIHYTVKAIKAGAVESFTWLVGPKPSAQALILRDGLISLLLSSFTIFGAITSNPCLSLISAGGLVGYGIKHVQGALVGRKFLSRIY